VVQRYVLDQIPDERLRVYVVWLAFHEHDVRDRAKEATIFFNDPRVRQFWASTLGLPEAYKAQLKLQKSAAWDVFLTFPSGATWTESVPAPVSLMHNLAELPDAQRLDGIVLGKELTKILAR
jgi:hypothetical protein